MLSWERIGLWMAVSVTFFIAGGIVLLLMQLLPFSAPVRLLAGGVASVLIFPALLAGACYTAHLVCSRTEAGYADMWRGAKALYRVSVQLGLMQMAVWGAGITGIIFYLKWHNMPGSLFALVCTWALVFWGMAIPYQMPVLVLQHAGVFDEEGKRAQRTARAAMRRSFYMAYDNLLFTGMLLAVQTLLFALLALTALGALLLPAFLALSGVAAARALLVRYALLPAPPNPSDAVPDEAFRLKAGETKQP